MTTDFRNNIKRCESMLRRFAISIIVTFCFGIMNAIGVYYEYTNRTDNVIILVLLGSTTMFLIVVYFFQAKFILQDLLPTYTKYRKLVVERNKRKDKSINDDKSNK